MTIENIEIQDYVRHFLREMETLYSFRGKNVVFMFYEQNINNAKAILEAGAKKVYFVNPDYGYTELENENIVLLNAYDLNRLEDNSIDLVIGLEILEHINDLRWIMDDVKRIVKPSGDVDLQGNPMWTCPVGHHLWIENKYIFYENSNPFEPWEHLIYDSKEDMSEALEKKGLPIEDCKEIAEWIYNPIEISRHTPSDVIEAVTYIPAGAEKGAVSSSDSAMVEIYRTDSWVFNFKRCFTATKPNEFFEKASEKYYKHDLKTDKFIVKMKKLKEKPNREESVEKINLSEIDSSIADIIRPFSQKHDIQGADVLNLSYYENDLISKIFISLGAKSVTSVNPKANDCSSEYIDIHNMTFEDFDTFKKHYDIVFGLDTLNHITDLNKFSIKIKQVTDILSSIYLTGFNPYTSACGHKIYTQNHHYTDATNPFKHWEHLTLKTEEQLTTNLKNKNLPDKDISDIVYQYYKTDDLCLYTPTEIETNLKNYLNIHMYRIYHYFEQNEFYTQAKNQYSENDLNTERIIVSSDLPTLYWLHELELEPHIEAALSDINLKYVFENKRVLNITPYIQYKITEGIEALRAKEVVSLDFHYSGYELRGGKNVVRANQNIQDLSNIPGKFDIIYGLDVLEHVKDIPQFYKDLENLIADKGVICLQGSPLWPSFNGHNCTIGNLDCGYLQTGYGDNKIEPWEHLAYATKEDLKQALLKKNFTEHDSEIISEYMFNSNEINRLSFVDYLNILDNTEGLFYGSKKDLDYTEENEFYEIASKKYSHEELRTQSLKLYIRKKLR